MPTLERPDLSMHFEVTGDGPPLLMLAGFMSDHASWVPLMPLLEPHFTCIRPDNRSTGQSNPWNAPISITHMAEDAMALMDHLAHDRFHILGHSMGGIITLDIANRDPARIASATVAASAPVRLARNTALFANLIDIRRSNAPPDTWLRALFPWLFNPALYDDPDVIQTAVSESLAYPHAQSADAMAHQLSALSDFDGSALAHPACPTQVLIGDRDLLIPPDHIKKALGHLPYHVLPDAGHSIHWDFPEPVAQYIMAFTGTHGI